MNFFSDLKPRNVDKVAVAYAVRLRATTRDNQWLRPDAENSAAAGYALPGEVNKALPLLEDSPSRPNGATTAYLRLNADWDGARNDPRFQKLMNAKP